MYMHRKCVHIYFFRGGEKYVYFTFLLNYFPKTHCILDFWDDWHWNLPAFVSNWSECGCSPRRRLSRRVLAPGAADFCKDRNALLSGFQYLLSTQHFPLGCPRPGLLSSLVKAAEVPGSWVGIRDTAQSRHCLQLLTSRIWLCTSSAAQCETQRKERCLFSGGKAV